MPKVDNMAMLMMKVVVMYDHDEYLPDVMFININVIFMYDRDDYMNIQYEYFLSI